MTEATATIALLVAALLIVSGCALWLTFSKERLRETLYSERSKHYTSSVVMLEKLDDLKKAVDGLGDQQGEAMIILRSRLGAVEREADYNHYLALFKATRAGAHGERCNLGTR